MKIGDILLKEKLITKRQLEEALILQKRWGSRLGDIVLSKGWVKSMDFYQALAEHYNLNFVNLMKSPADESLLRKDEIGIYLTRLFIPFQQENGIMTILVADPSEGLFEFLKRHYGKNIRFAMTSKFDIIWELQKRADETLSDRAVNSLLYAAPEYSALEVMTGRQVFTFFVLSIATITSLYFYFAPTLLFLNTLLTLYLFSSLSFKIYLFYKASDRGLNIAVSSAEIKSLDDKKLPIYTVLVPMYKEQEVLPIIASALRRMDYPISKLDIKLILEEDDEETIKVAKEMGLEANFEIIRVPPSLPKTKPKACNYALNFARGEYLTIYDAEDKPEPDQLKKAVAAYLKADPSIVCLQARLNYFNVDENWITRLFTLEYTLWFDFFIPALDMLGIPFPLGGTSNHFKTNVLLDLKGWDPFNVTEDADLGIRIAQKGYHVATISSTTYEEANTRLGNWIRQRSRWLKGYMQTYLVHMRYPIKTYKGLGHRGFWGFQFFIGGGIISILSAPILWGMFSVWLITGTKALDPFFPPIILYMNFINLLAGNGYLVYLSMLAGFRRHYYRLIPYGFLIPVYWFMMSIAGYKGLWQLISKPFFWEKTVHGISRFTARERERALAKV